MLKSFVQFRLIILYAGIILFFVSERYLNFESYYKYINIGALVLVAIATILPMLASLSAGKKSLSNEAKSWLYAFAWQLTVFIGLLLYVVYSKLIGNAASPDTFLLKALLAGWVVLLILGLFASVGVELSHRSSGTGKLAEPGRVARAGMSWLMAGLVLTFLISFNYVAVKKDKAFDWSYLKSSTPGEATVKMMRAYPEKLQIAIFYPSDNDVLTHVKEYFDYLATKAKNVEVVYYDKDLHPTKAEEFKVSRNGQVLFKTDEKKERLDIGLKLRSARSTLKQLDSKVGKTFLRLTESKKKIYFTRGHGEASWLGSSRLPLKSIGLLEKFLRSQNYSLKFLGLSEGSGNVIPEDAAVVVIAGPETAFLESEAEALKNYIKQGGKIMVFMDVARPSRGVPDITENADDPLYKFLLEAGIKFNKKLLGNDKNYVSGTRSPADRWFLFSNSFTSHESVTSLSKHEERVALVVYQSGYFDVTPKIGNWRAYTTVRSLSDTFVDLNKNFTFDKANEKRSAYSMAAAAVYDNTAEKRQAEEKENQDEKGEKDKQAEKAAEKAKPEDLPEGRIVALADATVISDVLIRNKANALFVSDSLKWLVGKSDFSGEIVSEQDIKIQHTRKEDVVWFYGTVVVVPFFVILIGFVVTRRRKLGKVG